MRDHTIKKQELTYTAKRILESIENHLEAGTDLLAFEVDEQPTQLENGTWTKELTFKIRIGNGDL